MQPVLSLNNAEYYRNRALVKASKTEGTLELWRELYARRKPCNGRAGTKENQKVLNKATRVNNPEKSMWHRAKTRALKSNISFNIDLEDIVIPDTCPILGIPIKKLTLNQKEQTPNSPSLDKIIPSLGYVKGNIQVISYRANLLKSNASKEEIELLYNWAQKNL